MNRDELKKKLSIIIGRYNELDMFLKDSNIWLIDELLTLFDQHGKEKRNEVLDEAQRKFNAFMDRVEKETLSGDFSFIMHKSNEIIAELKKGVRNEGD